MRVLGVGSCVDLGDLYLGLVAEGHEVRVVADDPAWRGPFAGLIDSEPDWWPLLPWVGKAGLILVEYADRGPWQDRLRVDGYQVIGGSALGDRLENDRAFGQSVLREVGLNTAESLGFATPAAAAEWLAAHPGRYVLKYDDSAHPTFVGEHPAGADVLFMLRRAAPGQVLLMRHLDGVEVGIGGYFDGARFLEPACIDFEHKRFFPGDRGEMTPEMGTLASYDHAGPLFEATLARLAPRLAQARHVGYVNLNLIANEAGLWPLELTCRFGYPGHLVLASLQRDGWGDLFGRMLDGRGDRFASVPGWSVAIVLTIPPFPGYGAQDAPEADPPVFFHDPPQGAEAAHYHLVDVRRQDGQLFARQRTGNVMAVTGTGMTVEAAQAAARARAANVIVPNLRWRADIGDRFLGQDAARLRALGWL